METLKNQGCGIFIEVGPHPVLMEMGRACLPGAGYGTWLPCLEGGLNDYRWMIESLGELYERDNTPDWRGC